MSVRERDLIYGSGRAKTGVTIMRRVTGQNGQLITQASLSTVAYSAKDITNDGTPSTGSLTITSVVFDALQQADPRWNLDSAEVLGDDGKHGYNFRATLAANLFPGPADSVDEDVRSYQYQIDVTFTPTSGEAFTLSWLYEAFRVYT